MKSICHLTSVHSRYDVRIFEKECKSLSKKGFSVSLIVADNLGDEIINGISIYDVGKYKGRLKRIFFTPRKVYKKARIINANVYHFHDPELMIIGSKLLKKSYKVIYDIHEDLAQQIKIKRWIPKFFRGVISEFFRLVEIKYARKMSALVVPQPYMKKKYSNYNKNVFLIENFVQLDNKTPKTDFSNKVCFHAGGLTKERGVLNMLNVFSEIGSDTTLYIAGRANNEIKKAIKDYSEKYSNIKYLGEIKFEEVEKYYKESSVGLILYNNVGQYYLSYAIKLFEYMSNSIPVIMPNFGEWVQFNEENNCGINVDPLNIDETIKAIKYLNDNIDQKKKLGENGRKAVIEKYNWSIVEKKMLTLYEMI